MLRHAPSVESTTNLTAVTMGVPVRRSLLKEAGIATSLGVVVAAGVVESSVQVVPNAIDASVTRKPFTAQVAYFGWYQMHASKQSRNMKEYYEQNPTTGEQMGEGVAVPGSD